MSEEFNKVTRFLAMRKGESFSIWLKEPEENYNNPVYRVALISTPPSLSKGGVTPYAVVCSEKILNGKEHYVALEDNLKTEIGDFLLDLISNGYIPDTWVWLTIKTIGESLTDTTNEKFEEVKPFVESGVAIENYPNR